jgi:GH24 family phage-related lysozyme (muramidase)
VTFSKKARELMRQQEGVDQPSKRPPGDSGITIGRGYDLRFVTPAKLRADWGALLTADQVTRLAVACGKGGDDAQAIAHNFVDIHITEQQADAVFDGVTIPEEVAKTRAAFPAFDKLPIDAQGALVSLVYNRGTSFGVQGKPSWESRREMRVIRDVLARFQAGSIKSLNDVLYVIAHQIELSKRLWEGGDAPGLVTRRLAEAALVRASVV